MQNKSHGTCSSHVSFMRPCQHGSCSSNQPILVLLPLPRPHIVSFHNIASHNFTNAMIYNIPAAKKVSFGGFDVRFYEKDLPPSSEPWKPCLVLNLDMMDWDVDMVDVRVRKVIRYCFLFYFKCIQNSYFVPLYIFRTPLKMTPWIGNRTKMSTWLMLGYEKLFDIVFYFILNAFKTHILFHYIFLGRPSR